MRTNSCRSTDSPPRSEYRSATSSADSHTDSQAGPDGRLDVAGFAGFAGVTGDEDTPDVGYHRLRSGASLDPRRHQRYFTLKVETCSSGTGRFLGILFWVLMICFILYGTAVIVLSSLDGSGSETKVTDAYYSSNMIILSVALGLVVLMAGIFVYRLHSALTRGGRTWRKLQPYLLWDAGVVASLTTLDLCCVVTAYALYVAAECFPSQTALVVLGFVRMMTFTGVVAWMTSTATLMQVISYDESTHADDGSAHADDDPTTATGDTTETTGKKTTGTFKVRLMVDEPISVILRKRWYVPAFYGIFSVVAVVVMAVRVVSVDSGLTNIPPKMSCEEDKLQPYKCASNTAADIITYAVLSVVLMCLWACYIVSVRIAWRTQKDLPNGRFRISKLFLRIQMRYGRLLFFAILFTGLLVELATIGTCRGRINAMLGSPAAHLSLAVYACTLLFLYAPGTERSDVVSIFKSVAWREGDVRLLMAELKACQEDRDPDVFEYLGNQLGIGQLSKMTNLQERVGSSVFCMEYGIKMFYYAWSAYKRSAREAFAAAGDASYPFSVEKGMRAFPGLISSKEFIDEETDTYGIMYWSADSIVLSFRGTASRKNVVTDLKATTIRYEPCPHIYGFPVLVHKGFWKAWSTVRERVIGEVLALAEGGGVERLFVTGHSLGGALACLCSVDLQAEFNRRMGDGRRQAGGDGSDPVPGIPGAEITLYDVEGQRSRPDLGKIEVHTYTFGAPRVGNTGFGAYANSLLSNYWHVVNTEDPVARIPKGPRYARSGHRVLLGRNGNMEIYPSHFESSLFTNVGGKVADHMMRTYATRLGQFIKAQFVPDLAVCDSEAELNCVRRMARNVEAESLGLEGLLCCSLGHLEDGLFELSLHPDCVASAPAELKQQQEQEGLKQQKQERTGRRNRRWLARLLPGRLKSTSADDSEIGSDSHGANRDEQGQRGENDVDEDELDMDFEEGLDDKVLQVLKGVWGD